MKPTSFFRLILFLCTMQFVFVFSMQDGWFKTMMSNLAAKMSNLSNWNAVNTAPKIPLGDVREKVVGEVSRAINDAVYQSYPVIKYQVVDWVYQQLSYVKDQIQRGLMLSGGIAVTGITILVIYKIYNKYLRQELTKDSALDLMVEALLELINDALTYPTFSTQIHALLKKDQFKIGLDETNEMFVEACSKVSALITAEKNKRNGMQDKKIDEAISKIVSEIASYSSSEEQLQHVIKNYISNENKFDTCSQRIINDIEKNTIILLGTGLGEKYIQETDGYIKAYKTILLHNLTTDEQRAAYSLYLRLKNKIAVEKLRDTSSKLIEIKEVSPIASPEASPLDPNGPNRGANG